MPDPAPQEALVILESSAPETAAEVERLARVLQSTGGRLMILDAGSSDLGGVRALPGVAHVLSGPAGDVDMPRLEPGDRLFLNAWLERHRNPKPEPRPGEGLPWDAPGRQPP